MLELSSHQSKFVTTCTAVLRGAVDDGCPSCIGAESVSHSSMQSSADSVMHRWATRASL